MASVATFGETMLRISPQDTGERLGQARVFHIEPGGSESNVAIALAMLGHRAFHITRLPDNRLGDLVVSHLRSHGVETSRIVRGGARVGCYWTETGIGPRPTKVLYDRADSAFATWEEDAVDWKAALTDVSWLHVSGITPGISEAAASTLLAGLKAAPAPLAVSMDLNFRRTMWTYVEGDVDRYVRDHMAAFCEHCDVLLGNESDFKDTLGIEAGDAASAPGRYATVAVAVFGRFPRVRAVAVSLRVSRSATENTWSGLLFVRTPAGMDTFEGPTFHLDHIVDRVGSGDSFVAGVLHGMLTFPEEGQRAVNFAVGLSALKHSVRGDASPFSEGDVWEVLESRGSGRIQR